MPEENRLIHFGGDWTRAERASIESAVERCETHIHVDIPPSCMGAPWIGAKEDVDGTFLYVVRRVNVGRTFEGPTLEEVYDQLAAVVLPL